MKKLPRIKYIRSYLDMQLYAWGYIQKMKHTNMHIRKYIHRYLNIYIQTYLVQKIINAETTKNVPSAVKLDHPVKDAH